MQSRKIRNQVSRQPHNEWNRYTSIIVIFDFPIQSIVKQVFYLSNEHQMLYNKNIELINYYDHKK